MCRHCRNRDVCATGAPRRTNHRQFGPQRSVLDLHEPISQLLDYNHVSILTTRKAGLPVERMACTEALSSGTEAEVSHVYVVLPFR